MGKWSTCLTLSTFITCISTGPNRLIFSDIYWTEFQNSRLILYSRFFKLTKLPVKYVVISKEPLVAKNRSISHSATKPVQTPVIFFHCFPSVIKSWIYTQTIYITDIFYNIWNGMTLSLSMFIDSISLIFNDRWWNLTYDDRWL